LADTGCGIAPSFQQATQATNQSTELGTATVTNDPSPMQASARRSPYSSHDAGRDPDVENNNER